MPNLDGTDEIFDSRDVIAREGDLLTVEDPLGAEHVVMRGDVDLTGRSAALVDAVGAAAAIILESVER